MVLANRNIKPSWRKLSPVFYLAAIALTSMPLWLTPLELPIKPFVLSEFSGLIGSLLGITAIVERAVEVLVGPRRDAGKAQLKANVGAAQEVVKAQPSAAALETALTAEHTVAEYEEDTRRLALGVALLLGLATSTVGFRALSSLVATGGFASLSNTQLEVFRVIDVFVTGALIAGGSSGLHQAFGAAKDVLSGLTSKP
jgi:hypothetical protein